MEENKGIIHTGNEDFDSIAQILLSTGMFIAGFLGFVLDNTIPGKIIIFNYRLIIKVTKKLSIFYPQIT